MVFIYFLISLIADIRPPAQRGCAPPTASASPRPALCAGGEYPGDSSAHSPRNSSTAAAIQVSALRAVDSNSRLRRALAPFTPKQLFRALAAFSGSNGDPPASHAVMLLARSECGTFPTTHINVSNRSQGHESRAVRPPWHPRPMRRAMPLCLVPASPPRLLRQGPTG